MTKTQRPTSPISRQEGFKALQKQAAVKPSTAKQRIEKRKLPGKVYDPKKPPRMTRKGQFSGGVIKSAAAGFSSTTVAGAPNIVELARALKSDVDEIFKFVYENIEWLPTYGSQKGALGCLIDGYGNSFDQSELMIELLREAGYTASYQLGELEMAEADAAAWLGTDVNIWAIVNLLSDGGIPCEEYWTGSEWKIRFTHCFVKCTISSTDYVFDPALKSYSTISGMNLATALSYSQSTFISNATSGATVATDYVQDINRSNIRGDLDDLTDNLISYIQSNNPDASTDDVLGGRTIDALTGTVRDTSHPELRSGTTPTTWSTDIPASYNATLNVYYWDATTPIDETFYSKDIHGKRLTLFFNGSHEAELRLDGTLVATSGAQTPGSWSSVWLEVVHPYPTTFADEGHWQTVWEGQYYLVAQGWGNAGPKMTELHRQKRDQAEFDGGSSTSDAVLGEVLSVIWHSWNEQKSRACDLLNRMTNCVTVLHHQTGLIGHFDTPLTDLGGIVWASSALDNDWDNVDTNDTSLAMHGIAFESAVIPQLVAGLNGISSTNLLDLANQNGDKIFDGNSSNWTSGVRPNLTNYDSGTLDDIESWWIDNGWRVAIPEDGDLTIVDWSGYGYFAISPYYGAIGIIGGGLKGSTGAEDRPNPLWEGNDPQRIAEYERLWFGTATAADPVDTLTGQFLYDHSDIAVGSQSTPYGVEFSRHYRSGANLKDGPLGLGWSHNHLITAEKTSNALLSLAHESPIQGAAGIVELYVTVDLLRDLDKPLDKLVMVAISNKWLMDQCTDNVVNVESNGKNITFVKLPDGTYARPLNVNSDLELSGGVYKLTTVNGVEFNFNSDGQISTIVYPQGVTITYTYTSGKLTSVSNGLGRTLTLSYTGDRITTVSDGNGRSVAYTYDGDGNLTEFDNPEGDTIEYEFDSSNRMIKYFHPVNPTSPLATNTYDSLGRVKEQKDAYDNTWKFYIAGPRAEEENPNGKSQVWHLNRFGKVVKHVNPLGDETTYTLDGLNRVSKQTLPEGNAVEFVYDANDNVTKVTAKAKSGSGLSDIVNEFTYDSTWNKVATAKDGRGNTTTYTYNGTTGTLTKIERPVIASVTPTVEFTYNSRGQLLTREDETDIVTKFEYDATKELLDKVTVDFGTGRLNLVTEFDYDSVGNLTQVTDPRGNATTFEYNDNRQRTKITAPSPLSYQTKFSYDANGNRTKVERETGDVSNPWQTVTTAYQIDGLIASITDPASNATSFTYNNMRRLWKRTDALSRVTEITYDDMSRIATVKDPATNTAVTRTYTDNGLLESVTDAEGNTTEYEHDGFDRLKKTTFEDSTYEQLTYDANSNVVSRLTRAGDAIDVTYDVLNRVTQKDPDNMPVVSYEYDLAGRRTKVSTSVVSGNPASGDFDYTYDTAGRLIAEECPDGKDVSYQLDSNGNVTRLTYPDGFYVEYVYDKLNRLTDIKLNGATSSALAFEYDKLSRRTKLTYENTVVTDYAFELDDDMSTLEHTFDSSSVEFSYGFNNAHELTSQDVDDSSFLWHPTAGGTVSYGTANSLNQYPSVGGTGYSYDDNGCLVDDGVFDFTYDTENQLIEADDGTTVSTYIYDPMRRQAQKNVGGTKTRYVYSGFRRIEDYDGSDNLVSRFVYGVALDEALIEIDSSGDKTYLHHDRAGSVVATTDDTGAVLNTYGYSPFGECGSMTGTSIGYTGQRFDPETGLYYYKNRHYSASIGRFLQPDPIGYADSLNLYQYAFNAPLDFKDPLGLTGNSNVDGWGRYQFGDPEYTSPEGWGNGYGYGNNHWGYGFSEAWAPDWAPTDEWALARSRAAADGGSSFDGPIVAANESPKLKGGVSYDEPDGWLTPDATWGLAGPFYPLFIHQYVRDFARKNNLESRAGSPIVNRLQHQYGPAVLRRGPFGLPPEWIQGLGIAWELYEWYIPGQSFSTPHTIEGQLDAIGDVINNVIGANTSPDGTNRDLLNRLAGN
ncbi:MAG: RHS repeat-associated core domain-containing protein [Candidatus Obscuribacterales bacterium]